MSTTLPPAGARTPVPGAPHGREHDDVRGRDRAPAGLAVVAKETVA
jgi:hypothetical protein